MTETRQTAERPPIDAILDIADAIARAIQEKPDLIPQVRALGNWLVSLSDEADARIAEAAAPEPIFQPTGMTTLNLGGHEVVVPVTGSDEDIAAARAAAEERPAPPDVVVNVSKLADSIGPQRRAVDLGVIVQRSDLKAEACRWAVERRRRLASPEVNFDADVKPTDESFKERGRELPECRMWALDAFLSASDDALEASAAAYENLAEAVRLTREIIEDEALANDRRPDAYELLAEAQSALRIAVRDASGRTDEDQCDAYHWLNGRTYDEQIYVPRYMKLSDPADPSNWSDLADRIKRLADAIGERERARRETKSLLNRIRYTVKRLPDRTGAERKHDWLTLFESINELGDAGVRPSDPDLRDALLPIFEDIPDDEIEPGDNMRLVMASIDQYLASREASMQIKEPPQRPPSPERERARKLLEGRTILLIGGERRPHSARNLERDLGLRELRWITTSPHESTDVFEPRVAAKDVDVVILAIRWASHSFENVREMCRRYGKAYVRLPGGYGSNSVAKAILDQVSGELGDDV